MSSPLPIHEDLPIPHDDLPGGQRASELIGQSRRMMIRQTSISPWYRSVDVNYSDYGWWDRARRGKVTGLELAGLLLKPLGSKVASWVLGQRPNWQTSNAKATDALNDWWSEWHPSILRAYNEALDLADCYLVVNADLSVTVVPPHMVTPLADKDDFSRPYGWKIIMQVPNPAAPIEMQTIEDYFTPLYRRRIVKSPAGDSISDVTYPNPIGRIPIIHVANRKGSDEFYGRPEGEALVNAMIRYGDVFDAALKGNIRQGRPTPVIEKMGSVAQVNAFWDQFGKTETHTNPDTGAAEVVTIIEFDPDLLLTLGGEATFAYKAPQPFTTDTQNLLQLLFYLMIQYSEVPEFAWGNAISASKASAETQLEPFLKWIIKRRGEAMQWMQELVDLVLAYMSVYQRRFKGLKATVRWRPLAAAEARITLDSIIYLYSKGKLSSEDLLWLMPLGIDDPASFIKNAEDEAAANPPPAAAPPAPAGAAAGTVVPASSGGNQQSFARQENPIQPTARQMVANLSDTQVRELAAQMLEWVEKPLYERGAEAITEHNRGSANGNGSGYVESAAS